MKRIYIDMDGVVADFTAQLETGKNKKDKGFFLTMPTIDGAIEAVRELSKYYEIHFLSTASWSNPDSWKEKRLWIEKHFPQIGFKRLHLSHNKHLFIGDYLIDDRRVNGASDFQGEHIHFGKLPYKNWEVVLDSLLPKEDKDILQQLTTAIQEFLRHCNDEKTPKVCNYTSSPEGRRMVLEDVIKRVANEGVTIAEAVLAIEKEFNQNRIED